MNCTEVMTLVIAFIVSKSQKGPTLIVHKQHFFFMLVYCSVWWH